MKKVIMNLIILGINYLKFFVITHENAKEFYNF